MRSLLCLLAGIVAGFAVGSDNEGCQSIFPGGQKRYGADPAMDGGMISCHPAGGNQAPQAIDGALDDPCWREADWNATGPSYAACWNAEFLYIAMRLHSRRRIGLSSVGPRDGPVELGSVVAIRLAPPDQQQMFVDLLIDSHGTVADRMMSWTPRGVSRYYQGFDLKGMRVATEDRPDGWNVEIAIPWGSLWNGAPRVGDCPVVRLQVAYRDEGDAKWICWPESVDDLAAPPCRFGLLLLGTPPPWRVLQGELVTGPSGPLLALALERRQGSSEEVEIIVSGDYCGRDRVYAADLRKRTLVRLSRSGKPVRGDGYCSFAVRASAAGRDWKMGGWHLRDPSVSGAGSIFVPGVGGSGTGSIPTSACGVVLSSTVVPLGRLAVNLNVHAVFPGPGPWRVKVRSSGIDIIDAELLRLPSVIGVPLAGLGPGRHEFHVVVEGESSAAVQVVDLPFEIIQ